LPWNFVCETEVRFQPDLPYRLIHDIALTIGDRTLYYAPGSADPKGYTDYAFASPVVKAQA
jgi:NADPH2 dehydrogenase